MVTTWRWIARPILIVGLGLPLIANCAAVGKVAGGAGLPSVPKCPDMSKPADVEAFDFQGSFNISAPGAAKLKAGTIAALDLSAVAAQVDNDLKTGCGGLATDLGAAGDFKSGADACQAAIKQMSDVRAKIGANAKYTLDIKPPACGASMKLIADCSAKCDASVSPGSAKVECEAGKLEGTCSAQCTGTCDFKAAAKCDGDCSGTCDAAMKGSCGGKCDGKCDGKSSKGATCNGTCDGKCDGQIGGTCKGQCGGGCKFTSKGSCDGTCSGGCSVDFQEPKCTGKVTPPKVSAECGAKCDGEVNAKVECTPAKVALRIEGATDAGAASAYKQAIEKNLPAVLKVSIGMAEHAKALAEDVTTVVSGVKGSITEIASAGGAAKAAMTAGSITACVGAPFKGAIDAAAGLKGNVDVSINVQASVTSNGASASASGSASAGAK